MLTLLPFQKLGSQFLAMRRMALLADDMGLGKTIQAIEAAKICKLQNGLVICPLNVRRTWLKTFRSQYPAMFLKELTSSRAYPDPKAFNIVNYDIVWREPLLSALKKIKWPVLICDEAHFFKSHDSNRTKEVLGRKGLYNYCDRQWMLTGTPVQNRPIELYPILRSLIPELLGGYKDYYSFAFKFCAGYQGPFGFNADGASNLAELNTLLSSIMMRRTKEEVLPDLPDIIFDKIYLDPSDKLMNLVEKESRASKVKDGEVASIRQGLGLLKIKPAIDHIKTILTEKSKVVVYTWHREVANGLKDAFKESAVLFTGEQSTKEKEENKLAFIENPKIKIFIGQITAAGSAIDGLQKVCDTCVFVELTYVPGQIMQCIDRLRRIGQRNSVQAQFLIAEGSMDEELIDTLSAKHKTIKTIYQEENHEGFAGSVCMMCHKPKPLSKLTSAAKIAVCEECQKEMECIL